MSGTKSGGVLVDWLPQWTKRQVFYVAGGLLVGCGGYFAYKRFRAPAKMLALSKADKPTASSSSLESVVEVPSIVDLKAKGNELFREKKYHEAIEMYTAAIVVCPSNKKDDKSICYQNRAAAFEKINDQESVVADCNEALKLNRTYVKAIVRRATAYEKLSKYQESFRDFMKACILENFLNRENVDGASRILKELAEQLVKEELEKRGDATVPLSKTMVDDMIAFYSTDPIFSKIQRRNVDGAGDSIVNGHVDETGAAETGNLSAFEKAKLSLMAKRYDEVIGLCSEVLSDEQNPHSKNALLLRATFHIFVGASTKANKDLQRLLDILRNAPLDDSVAQTLKCNAYIKLALLHQQLNNYDESLKNLTEAEQIDPLNPDIYSQRGLIYNSMNKLPEANDMFMRAVQLNPIFPLYSVQKFLGEFRATFESENETAMHQTLDDIETLTKDFPNCAEVQGTFGQILCDVQDYEKAEQYLDAAVRLAPDNANMLVRRGVLSIYKKNVPEGQEFIEKALKIDPYCLLALETLAQHYAQASDFPKMMEYYEKALGVVKSASDMNHLITMRETTLAQMKIAEDMYAPASVLST